MSIDFTCPHCHARTVVADEYAGQSGPCSNCGQSITVPLAGMTPPPVMSRPASSGGKSTGTIVMIIVAAAAVGLLACGGVLVALLLPAVQSAREAARRSQCQNNLKQIGLAMHNYHDANNSLPPAYQAGPDGKPMHSWRVLLLPYLEAKSVYDSYDMEQPWDSPANRRIQSMMPVPYNCPSDPQSGQLTDYVVVTGALTMFDGAKAARFADITDGLSNTIMVVEAVGMNIPWTEPRDLAFDQMSMAIGSQPGNCVHSHHPGGATVLLADGSVRFLRTDLPPETLRALLTKSGGEMVGGNF